MKLHKKAFTLIEILIAILIVAIVLIVGFKAYSMVLAGKVRLIEKTNLEEEAFFFTERLLQDIKEGGVIDYEEYFNRMVVNANTIGTALYKSGHYLKETGFGNFGKGGKPGETYIASSDVYGDGFYYCRSANNQVMSGTGGCFNDERFSSDISGNQVTGVFGQPQRYGQYSLQFMDYNSNFDDDKGNEDRVGTIIGDDDDDSLGNSIELFENKDVRELYLISGNKKTRTIFRYNAKLDPNVPSSFGFTCDPNTGKGKGCQGTIEFLKLDGKDWGLDHDINSIDIFQNDGVIDTWVINSKFAGEENVVVGMKNLDSYFKPLFSDRLNVSEFKLFLFPSKDQNKAYKDDVDKMVSPYVQLSFLLEPSWEMKSRIKGKVTPIYFNQTINLTDIFSK